MIVEAEHLIALEHIVLCSFVLCIVLCALPAFAYVCTQDERLYITATYGCAIVSHVYRLYLIVSLLAWREANDETNGDVRELRDIVVKFLVAFVTEATIGALLVGDRMRRDQMHGFWESARTLIQLYFQLFVNTADALVSLRFILDRDAYIGSLLFVIVSLCSVSVSSTRLYHAIFMSQAVIRTIVAQNPLNTFMNDDTETTIYAYGLLQDGPMLVARMGMLLWRGHNHIDTWHVVFMVKNLVQIFMALADRPLRRRICNNPNTTTLLCVAVVTMTILAAAIQYKAAFLLNRNSIVGTLPVCHRDQTPFQTPLDAVVSDTKPWRDLHDNAMLASLVIVFYGAVMPVLL